MKSISSFLTAYSISSKDKALIEKFVFGILNIKYADILLHCIKHCVVPRFANTPIRTFFSGATEAIAKLLLSLIDSIRIVNKNKSRTDLYK